MRPISAVFRKEVKDNFRDRRTLLSALLMGPLFGPVLFAVVINLSLKQVLEDPSTIVEVPVIGQEYAGNLMTFMKSKNLDAVAGPPNREAALQAVKDGVHDFVVVVSPEFGDDLRETIPATVEVITDEANKDAERQSRRVARSSAIPADPNRRVRIRQINRDRWYSLAAKC